MSKTGKKGVKMRDNLGTIMNNKWAEIVVIVVLILGATLISGCYNDPTAIGRFRATPVTNVILDNLGVADEDPPVYAGARDPRPSDLQVVNKEYVIHSGDVINVKIMDLFATGVMWQDQMQVSETGRITIPEIGTFRAAGYTEFELTDLIKQKLSPDIIKNPSVSVVVVGSTERMYSVSGAVAAPNRYPLTQNDLRISEALAQAGGIPQSNADYAYVIRKVTAGELEAMQREANQGRQNTRVQSVPAALPSSVLQPTVDVNSNKTMPAIPAPPRVKPRVRASGRSVKQPSGKQPANTDKAKRKKLTPQQEREELLRSIEPVSGVVRHHGGGQLALSADSSPIMLLSTQNGNADKKVNKQANLPAQTKKFKVVREGGKFKPLTIGPAGKQSGANQSSTGKAAGVGALPVGRQAIPPAPTVGGRKKAVSLLPAVGSQEVIRINLKKLRGGDLSQNIVIRAGDDIQVPLNNVGIFYVWGQVARPGPYQLSGDRMTLTEAIASVGGLTSLAWASRCSITRRIGENRQVTQMINLQKLLTGAQPDYFIKPNDVINVGSHPLARWVAVIRQGFRTTYGFGFVYDRNLADVDFGHNPWPGGK